jgi:hypothetical protein
MAPHCVPCVTEANSPGFGKLASAIGLWRKSPNLAEKIYPATLATGTEEAFPEHVAEQVMRLASVKGCQPAEPIGIDSGRDRRVRSRLLQ